MRTSTTLKNAFKKGHPYYPPKVPYKAGRLPPRSNKWKLASIEKRIFRTIELERDGEMTADQIIHAKNAARLGALAEDLFNRANRHSGSSAAIDPIAYSNTYATLVNAQSREIEALND